MKKTKKEQRKFRERGIFSDGRTRCCNNLSGIHGKVAEIKRNYNYC